MTFKELVESRYERNVISGTKVVHDGDCDIYRCKVCTCGLLHLLRRYSDEALELYPNFSEEIGMHDRGLDHLQRNPVLPLTKEEIERAEALLQQLFGNT